MESYDVIIIGGGPSGIITGFTGKKQNPTKSFLMIKEEAKGLVPCGIPYIFHDLDGVQKNEMGPAPYIAAGGEVLVDQVVDIDIAGKSVKTKAGQVFGFGKLIFATGSVPMVPKFIKSHDLRNVEYIRKSHCYMDELRTKALEARDIVIIGGGFIGVEVAEQLAKHPDKRVRLVEMRDHCLSAAFSEKLTSVADQAIRDAGVDLHTSSKVMEIQGENGAVKAVLLEDGTRIDADLVILSIGYVPNTDLARKAGLPLAPNGAIKRDNYMRTPQQDIFAVGDCSESIGFITGRSDNIMLASTATAEARILGYNLFGISLTRSFQGTLSVFSTEINGKVFASAGAIRQVAQEAGIVFVEGEFEDTDRHPETFPDTHKLFISLIVSPATGVIIGAEVLGGKSAGEIINIIGLAIQKGVTVYELISYQIGTHPLLTPAPTKYVLIKAAEAAIAKICKK